MPKFNVHHLEEAKARLLQHLELWVREQEDPSKPLIVSTDGRGYSAEDIFREISEDTEAGNEILMNWFAAAMAAEFPGR